MYLLWVKWKLFINNHQLFFITKGGVWLLISTEIGSRTRNATQYLDNPWCVLFVQRTMKLNQKLCRTYFIFIFEKELRPFLFLLQILRHFFNNPARIEAVIWEKYFDRNVNILHHNLLIEHMRNFGTRTLDESILTSSFHILVVKWC